MSGFDVNGNIENNFDCSNYGDTFGGHNNRMAHAAFIEAMHKRMIADHHRTAPIVARANALRGANNPGGYLTPDYVRTAKLYGRAAADEQQRALAEGDAGETFYHNPNTYPLVKAQTPFGSADYSRDFDPFMLNGPANGFMGSVPPPFSSPDLAVEQFGSPHRPGSGDKPLPAFDDDALQQQMELLALGDSLWKNREPASPPMSRSLPGPSGSSRPVSQALGRSDSAPEGRSNNPFLNTSAPPYAPPQQFAAQSTQRGGFAERKRSSSRSSGFDYRSL